SGRAAASTGRSRGSPPSTPIRTSATTAGCGKPSLPVRSRPLRGAEGSAPRWAGKRLPRPAGTPFGSADPNQLLVDELVRPVLPQLAPRAGALDAAERQLGAVRADD